MFVLSFAKKLLLINKSYHCAFKSLNQQEIDGLCTHEEFLRKVHQELESNCSQLDINSFNRTLDLIRTVNTERRWKYNWNNFQSSFLNNNLNNINYLENIFFESSAAHSYRYIYPLSKMLINRLGSKEAAFGHVNKSLYQHDGTLRLDAVQDLVKGFSIEDLSSYEGIDQAVHLVSSYVKNIWVTSNFTEILGYCNYNEKFVFLLIYPYLLVPLGETFWRTLLPVFYFVSGSFLEFMEKVSNNLNRGGFLFHKFMHKCATLKVSKWVKSVMFSAVWSPITVDTIKLICTIVSTRNLTILTIVHISLSVVTFLEFFSIPGFSLSA